MSKSPIIHCSGSEPPPTNCNNFRVEARLNLSRPNMAVHTVYGRKNTVSYGAIPYRIPYRQHSTKSLDGTGAVAVIRHRTTVGLRHGAQPYSSHDTIGFQRTRAWSPWGATIGLRHYQAMKSDLIEPRRTPGDRQLHLPESGPGLALRHDAGYPLFWLSD
jgi:hypothetical protein